MSADRDYDQDWLCTFRVSGDPNDALRICRNRPAYLMSRDSEFVGRDVVGQAICREHEGKYVLVPSSYMGRLVPVARGGIPLDFTPWAVVFTLQRQQDEVKKPIERLTFERDEAQRLLREQHEWRDSAVRQAHEWADDNNLCSTFDDFMEEIGLPRREREYAVLVQVEASVTVNVTAASEEDAERLVSRDQVIAAIENGVSYAVDDWRTDGAEEA